LLSNPKEKNMRHPAIKGAAGLLAALIAVVSLSGCSAANKGGNTTCGQYRSMNSTQQTNVVKKMLSDEGQSTSNGNITLIKFSVAAFCATLGSDSDPISKING